MSKSISISKFFSLNKPIFSLEFFPPKNDMGDEKLLKTAKVLKPYSPNFVSMTYGAGGGTRDKTMHYARILKNEFGFEVMPHLTCVGHTRKELLEILEDFSKEGFVNIMALRGDPPMGENQFRPIKDGLSYATELVALIRKYFPHFGIGVGGYPEKHPESPSEEMDLIHLKEKVDAGADFITTQLFFDNQVYFEFVNKCQKAEINAPILPGLLPVQSMAQIKRFCKMCEASLPYELLQKLENTNTEKQSNIGCVWAKNQVKELLQKGAPGFHLYALNQSEATLEILDSLKKKN